MVGHEGSGVGSKAPHPASLLVDFFSLDSQKKRWFRDEETTAAPLSSGTSRSVRVYPCGAAAEAPLELREADFRGARRRRPAAWCRVTKSSSSSGKMKRSARRLEVEKAIRRHGWSGSWVRRLAERAGCSVRTVERDRDEVVAALADVDLGDRERRRVLFLAELRGDMARARRGKQWGAVLRARSLEAKVLGFDRVPPPPTPPAEIEGEDPLERRLRMTRYRIELAQSRGAMTAAAKLADREQAILDELAERRRLLEERRRLSSDESALLDRVEKSLDRLPEAVLDKLAARILARRET